VLYHILPEWEEFSAFRGGAVANIIANMMRFEVASMVVTQSADDTWEYPPERIMVLAGMKRYHRFYARLKGKRFLFPLIYKPILRHIFQRLLSTLQPGDIVWCHSQIFILAALEAEIHSKGAKVIYHAHSSLKPYSVHTQFRLFKADAIVFVSEAIRQKALRLAPGLKRTLAIHNGVNHDLFFPKSRGPAGRGEIPKLLFVGRLNPEKGIHILVDAIKILNGRNRNVACRVVGSAFSGGTKPTPFVNSLLKSAPSNITFVGYRVQTEIAAEYRGADILCCPSVFDDPFPGVPLEGMASGLPIVATCVGGIPEMATEGGFVLVEPNSALQLANALDKLIQDEGLRSKLASEGFESSRRRFAWETVYKQDQNLIDHVRGTSKASETACC
jgi:spore coat protein SA